MEKEKVIRTAPEELGSDMGIITEGVLKAGKLALKRFGKDTEMQAKGFQEGIVTQTDKLVDDFLIKFLTNLFPNEKILTEESYDPSQELGDSYFVVDPIDGTNHFARSLPDWSIVVAHVKNNTVDMATIYAPVVKELYFAKKGKGAYKNGRRMQVSNRKNIGIQIGRDTVRFFNRMDIVEKAMKQSQMHIVVGSTELALARLANGQIEIGINMGQPVWDFAAGMLMIQEAGGKSTNFSGEENFDLSGKKTNNYVASNVLHHTLGLSMVKS